MDIKKIWLAATALIVCVSLGIIIYEKANFYYLQSEAKVLIPIIKKYDPNYKIEETGRGRGQPPTLTIRMSVSNQDDNFYWDLEEHLFKSGYLKKNEYDSSQKREGIIPSLYLKEVDEPLIQRKAVRIFDDNKKNNVKLEFIIIFKKLYIVLSMIFAVVMYLGIKRWMKKKAATF